jgi:hypothetical protein
LFDLLGRNVLDLRKFLYGMQRWNIQLHIGSHFDCKLQILQRRQLLVEESASLQLVSSWNVQEFFFHSGAKLFINFSPFCIFKLFIMCWYGWQDERVHMHK